jgi:hypothetical protein
MRLHTISEDFDENDIPFVKNELRDQPGTMGKPLDTADAPGKADSEIGGISEAEPVKAI